MAKSRKTLSGSFDFKKSKQTGYPQFLDNGVIEKPGARRIGSFGDLVAEGENPKGLMVQTANGTSRQDCVQQQRPYHFNPESDRWDNNQDWDGDMTGN